MEVYTYYSIWFWLLAIVVFGVTEILTTGLVSIWFAVGAVAALFSAVLGAGGIWQLAVFAAASAAALAVGRHLVRRHPERMVPTNADRVLGKTGRVVEDIPGAGGGAPGAVYVDGKTWSARSADGQELPVDTAVRIKSIEGVKLLVEKLEIMEEAK